MYSISKKLNLKVFIKLNFKETTNLNYESILRKLLFNEILSIMSEKKIFVNQHTTYTRAGCERGKYMTWGLFLLLASLCQFIVLKIKKNYFVQNFKKLK